MGADAIFLGRVSFTNDDGSGTFAQNTLVRFDVDERLKGVAPDVREVWVNPGSHTSCYEEYHLGEQYLVFARRSQRPYTPVLRDRESKAKPTPPGFDPAKPPPVYDALECASRRASRFPYLDSDLAILRAYRAGTPVPRILGHTYLRPFRGWPVLSGPALAGARVTLSSGAAHFQATTDAKGDFSLPDAPAGSYSVQAGLDPFHMAQPVTLYVSETGCGYVVIELTTNSTLNGVVLDHRGNPAPKIPVEVWLNDRGLEDSAHDALRAETGGNERFAIKGLPDMDVYLSAGSDDPTTRMPYRRIYYPDGAPKTAAAFRLKPGEQSRPVVLRLGARLERSSVKVRVWNKQGTPLINAVVAALDDRANWAESAKVDARGVARVPCLRGLTYALEARTLHPRTPSRGSVLKSSRVPFVCGGSGAAFELIADQPAPY